MAHGRLVEQRTLCRAIGSGERAELHHDGLARPEFPLPVRIHVLQGSTVAAGGRAPPVQPRGAADGPPQRARDRADRPVRHGPSGGEGGGLPARHRGARDPAHNVEDYLDYISNRVLPDASIRRSLEKLWSASAFAGSPLTDTQLDQLGCVACGIDSPAVLDSLAEKVFMIVVQDFQDPYTLNLRDSAPAGKGGSESPSARQPGLRRGSVQDPERAGPVTVPWARLGKRDGPGPTGSGGVGWPG